MFSTAADLAPPALGFTRAIVASVRDHRLSASDSVALRDPASDELRRLLLAMPVDLDPDTEETACVRRAGQGPLRALPSRLAETLGLQHYAYGVVAPDSVTLALLVVDRPGPPVSPEDRANVGVFSAILGIALEHLVLRRRVADLSQEVREFSGVAQALAREALDAPPFLDHGPARPAPAHAPAPAADVGRGGAAMRLTPGERRIAALLAEGRSNREIADALVVSPETVKSHVGKILRKLGVANRVEAASLLLRDS